jgi:hypothetical protein
MDEFVRQISEQARQAAVEISGRELLRDENPILELIGLLLGDGYGDVRDQESISTQQWLDWHHLITAQPEELIETIHFILDWEQKKLPTELEAMRVWAASLMLLTFDEMGMM